ncbi:Cytoplasmic 1 [Mycena kentingensis (nom. inval.)]|nr:Cytoplasmic 1 [Mycena kentingensis (nom. inval.)]
MDYRDLAAIVIDNGSGLLKAGYAGDDGPRAWIPTVVGEDGQSISEEAQQKSSTLRYPIQRGIVENWDDLALLYTHIFTHLLAPSEPESPLEQALFLTASPVALRTDKAKLLELTFERFLAPAAFVENVAVLPTYASAGMTGVVLLSGDSATHAVPVHQGVVQQRSVRTLTVAGLDVTRMLRDSVNVKLREVEAAWVKESMCYVARDSADKLSESAPANEQEYTLPDGRVVSLGSERFMIPETLFEPSLAGISAPGIHQLIHDAAMSYDLYGARGNNSPFRHPYDLDLEREMTTLVSGGSTVFPGFVDRLERELRDLAPAGSSVRVQPQKIQQNIQSLQIRVIALAERRKSDWIGGSILASLSTFQDKWITRQEWEEAGPAVMYRTVSSGY